MQTKSFLRLLLSVVLSLSFASTAFAEQSGVQQSNKAGLDKYSYEFKKYAKQLEVTEEVPYKEVQLEDGTILFNEIKISKNIGNKSSMAVSTAVATETSSMTSSQGYKNIFGNVLYKLDYTTVWTYDYSTVLSSYSYTSVQNGAGWSFVDDDNFGPGINDSGREHQWTGTAKFAIIVAGIHVNNETLLNHHRVRYNGTYAWKYEIEG
jgi:hypothetical protein